MFLFHSYYIFTKYNYNTNTIHRVTIKDKIVLRLNVISNIDINTISMMSQTINIYIHSNCIIELNTYVLKTNSAPPLQNNQ